MRGRRRAVIRRVQLSSVPRRPVPKWILPSAATFIIAVAVAIAIPYYQLSKRVDRQLAAGAFQHTFTYFAAPEMVTVGDPVSARILPF